MYLSETYEKKWQPVLEHPDLPKIGDSYRRAVTATILENQERAQKEDNAFLNEAAPANNTSGTSNWDPILISLVRRAIKNHNSYSRFIATFYRPEVIRAKDFSGFKYLKHNVASSPNPGVWWDTQIKQWGPFIKKYMNNGKINQEIWAPGVRINPVGSGYNWNVISIDGFNSLSDMFQNGGKDYPSMESVDNESLNETMPDGWYKQVIWERVMWLDDKGKFME